jgi:hypothetical protein
LSFENVGQDLFIQKDIKGFENDGFYVIKPNEYKSWHPALAYLDLSEFIDFNKEKIIDKQSIRSYLEYLYSKQIKRSSYLRKLSSLNQFISFLIEEKFQFSLTLLMP